LDNDNNAISTFNANWCANNCTGVGVCNTPLAQCKCDSGDDLNQLDCSVVGGVSTTTVIIILSAVLFVALVCVLGSYWSEKRSSGGKPSYEPLK
jgi:hypothetical protein